MTLFWDIETARQREEAIRRVARPFERPPAPGEFNPANVKLGNTKDKDKIADKIEAARTAHEAAVQTYETDCEKAEAVYWQEKFADAALSAATGQVVAIGCLSAENGKTLVIGEQEQDEGEIITKFWSLYRSMRTKKRAMVGVNIFLFDLPFLVRRSWILGIDVPGTVRDGRYWDRTFVDLRDVWLLGQRWGDCESSLDHMAKALGVGAKSDGLAGGCTGATFAQLWLSGDPQQRATARAYLVNDLELPQRVAARMGIV